jgi:hypothetical protein
MNKYCLETIRRKAYNAGYRVEKNFQRYRYNGSVVRDENGKAYSGYEIINLSTGFSEWKDAMDDIFDYNWTLQDVEKFLNGVYREAGLTY